jgi:hypothetical protein
LCYQGHMRWIAVVFMILILGLPGSAPVEAQTVVSDAPGKDYDTRFFQALQRIFETFNDGDLQRVFQAAQPIGCSDLLGDWRTAAFFNENRNLERWYYKTFEEVQADLSRYIFQGQCGSESATVEVVSRFPVRQSMEAYNKGEIEFARIAFKVNAPVKASFDSRARAYTFELPYLYITGRNGASNTYSMMPPDAAAKYAQEVTNRWDCKAVKDTDTTYRFLLCRTGILPRNTSLRNQTDGARGASAYVLLTDGREARATFTLSFPTSSSPIRRSVAAMSRIADLGREDFQLRFVNRSWEFRIASPVTLAAGQFSAVDSTAAVKGDHCEWRPQSPATAVLVDENDKTVKYYMTRADRSASSPVSFTFEAMTVANFRLGVLRCVFPGGESAAGIEMKRLLSVLGDHINIELR